MRSSHQSKGSRSLLVLLMPCQRHVVIICERPSRAVRADRVPAWRQISAGAAGEATSANGGSNSHHDLGLGRETRRASGQLLARPCRRATCEATAPGANVSDTKCRFSSLRQRRRFLPWSQPSAPTEPAYGLPWSLRSLIADQPPEAALAGRLPFLARRPAIVSQSHARSDWWGMQWDIGHSRRLR